MVSGIGIDLCSISRIEKALRSEHFRTRIFTPEEIAYCEKNGAKSYASCFAAREAFVKASGIELSSVMFGGKFSLRHTDGKPEIIYPDYDSGKIFVSISHEGDYACAMVVIES